MKNSTFAPELKGMRHIFVVITVLLGNVALAQVNQTDAQGRKQGVWEKHFEDSNQLRYRGEFVNDVPVGTFTYYHINGNRRSVIEYRGTTGVGFATLYEFEGWKMAEGKFVNQVRDSTWRYFGPGGQLVSTEVWVDGQKHGPEKTFFHDGKVAEVINWSHGLREGPWMQKYPDGELKARGNYVNDVLHGHVMYFAEDGKPMWAGEYVRGRKNGSWIIYSGRSAHIREIYDMGELISEECLSDDCPELEVEEEDKNLDE